VPRKIRQLKVDLRRAGFASDPGRGKGRHTAWVHQPDTGIKVTLSGHDGDDAKHYREREGRDTIDRARAKEESR
jgi:predicted RNA binding protein YcfA (HicA-like mRNA interferase family)